MHKVIKKQWLKALRSGKYKQVKGDLRSFDGQGYCCLGVLCDVVKDYKSIKGYWDGTGFIIGRDGTRGLLPDEVAELASTKDGKLSVDGDLPMGTMFIEQKGQGDNGDTLVQLNDGGLTFEEIANVIEEQF